MIFDEAINYLIAFSVSLTYIYLKAWQQINVIHKRYKQMPIPSLLMALCEVSIIGLVVKNGFWVFIPIGIGGALGCMLSVWKNHK